MKLFGHIDDAIEKAAYKFEIEKNHLAILNAMGFTGMGFKELVAAFKEQVSASMHMSMVGFKEPESENVFFVNRYDENPDKSVICGLRDNYLKKDRTIAEIVERGFSSTSNRSPNTAMQIVPVKDAFLIFKAATVRSIGLLGSWGYRDNKNDLRMTESDFEETPDVVQSRELTLLRLKYNPSVNDYYIGFILTLSTSDYWNDEFLCEGGARRYRDVIHDEKEHSSFWSDIGASSQIFRVYLDNIEKNSVTESFYYFNEQPARLAINIRKDKPIRY